MPAKKDAGVTDTLNLALKSDDRPAEERNSTDHQNLVQKTIGLLGVPGFILNTFGPQILKHAKRYPRLFSFLAPFLVFLSGAAAFTYLIWPLMNVIVGDWLPFARLKSDDPLYDYLCRWVHYRRHPFRHLELDAQSAGYKRQQSHDRLWWPRDYRGSKDIVFDQAGKRYFWYSGTLFILETTPSTGRRSYYSSSQDMKLKAVALSHQPIKDVLLQAWKAYQREEGSRTTKIWHYQDDCWEHLAYKDVRPLDTVDMDDMEKKKLVQDLEIYLSDDTKTWYSRRGIPYRRGYLFHGPPGTGKTSLSMAIAGRFNLDMYIMSLANPKLNDSMLSNLMTQVDTPAVVLLEDVDSAGLTREISNTVTDKPLMLSVNDDDVVDTDKLGRLSERVEKCNVTLSGVLNALDGAASPEGHILIMSTNAPEALDPALARAGRVDFKVAFKNASFETAKNIFRRMIGEQEGLDLEMKATEFASRIPSDQLSPAELQGYLLNHINDVNAAMVGIDRWVVQTLKEKEEQEQRQKEKREKAAQKQQNEEVKTT